VANKTIKAKDQPFKEVEMDSRILSAVERMNDDNSHHYYSILERLDLSKHHDRNDKKPPSGLKSDGRKKGKNFTDG